MRKSKYTVGDFNLRVGKSKTGKGLFATSLIPKGSCIIEYIGKPIAEEKLYGIKNKYLFEIAKNKTIDGNIPENKARYINHSCRPNCEAEGPSGHVYIMAIKNIKEGEELTYDYGKEYFDENIKPKGCKCDKCMGVKQLDLLVYKQGDIILDMNIKIRSTNFELTPAIEDYVNKKIGQLERFYSNKDGILCDVEIGKTTEHHKSGDIFKAEVNINAAGSKQVYVVAEEADLYKAIDVVRDEAEREIVSDKNKKETLFRRGASKIKDIIKGIRRN